MTSSVQHRISSIANQILGRRSFGSSSTKSFLLNISSVETVFSQKIYDAPKFAERDELDALFAATSSMIVWLFCQPMDVLTTKIALPSRALVEVSWHVSLTFD